MFISSKISRKEGIIDLKSRNFVDLYAYEVRLYPLSEPSVFDNFH